MSEWIEITFQYPRATAWEELRALFEGGARGDVFDRWLRLRGLEDPEPVRTMVDTYRDHSPILSVFSDVAQLLPELGARYRVGLLSDGYLRVQRAKFAALGVEPFFDAVVFTDELGRDAWKPSPVGFAHLTHELEIEPSHAVYVGDNPRKDFLAARAAGLACIRVRRSGGEYAAIEPETPMHAADLTVGDLRDLEGSLRKLIDLPGSSSIP